jgi:hypothetical protein
VNFITEPGSGVKPIFQKELFFSLTNSLNTSTLLE